MQESQSEILFHSEYPEMKEIENAIKLCECASFGDIKGIEQLVKEGYNINSSDYDSRTALHIAAAVGNIELVKWLIANGAKIKVDRFGGLPIQDALRNNHQEIADFLQKFPIFTNTNLDPQCNDVFQLVLKEGIFSYQLIAKEVKYFFKNLGIDQYYFKVFQPQQIAKHIHSFIAAKKVAEIARDKENIKISIEDQNGKFYLCTTINQRLTEIKIEEYIKKIDLQKSFSVIYMKSEAPALKRGKQALNLFIVREQEYKLKQSEVKDESDINQVSSVTFLQKQQKVIDRYSQVMKAALTNPSPAFTYFQLDEIRNTVIMFGVKQGKSEQDMKSKVYHFSYQEILSRIFETLSIEVNKKLIESFQNGIVIYTFYTKSMPNQKQLIDLRNIANLVFTTPQNPLTEHFLQGQMTGRELLYFYSAAIFTYYFIHENLEDYESLYKYLEKDQINLRKLLSLKNSLISETVKLSSIWEIIKKNLSQCKELFIDFARRMQGSWENFQYKDINTVLSTVVLQEEKQVLQTFYLFNQSVLKTNFYHTQKSCCAYRLDPKVFLQKHKYPEVPFGIFLFIGSDFQGFHLRFRDISRGGVRIIKSTPENFDHNRVTQFQENYGLAFTQKMKNKDILESGSKGTILLLPEKNHCASQAFFKYIDALLDLILIKEGVTDLYKEKEIIFLGPDENTADLMDLACLFARDSGYKYWKSFTTGKSVKLGGIPHDRYGMTTRSVRAYVTGIMRKLNLKEEDCTKVMTGGPDGDLGSNEILMSKEKIIAIIDGSGVLYDPQGIHRPSIEELAHKRQPINFFNGPLSKEGYKILISDKDIALPSGEVVASGINFRNTYHLRQEITADFLVPCGGRPEAVNLLNVEKMFTKNDNTPRFKYIVEGANLFISENARGILEDAGIILFKDASANKGGVTSSSYEVMAALSMNDEEFTSHMTIDSEDKNAPESSKPEFYQKYVQEIEKRIEYNATLEFEYIWNMKKEMGALKRNIEITNELSESMNDLCDIINSSKLFFDEKIKFKVLTQCIPEPIQKLVGFEKLMERLPINYQQSMFSAYLAAQYFYKFGAKSNVYLFYEFMKSFEQQ